MREAIPQLARSPVELPASAPMIRVTAGLGSAGQKTWNIRRPVTLIGASRPAHIVLHDNRVSKCHCAIVNTGAEVLLKDLHTTHGTYCNKERMALVVLKDGDVITVGDMTIQVAIRTPENQNDDSACGLAYADPTLFPEPITLKLHHTDCQWRIEEAVVLIGRHPQAEIRVDHPDVAPRHAVLFRFAGSPALFDLGSRNGTEVNGQRCPQTGLQDGDLVAIGPCALSIRIPKSLSAPAQGTEQSLPAQPPADDPAPQKSPSARSDVEPTAPPVEGRFAEAHDTRPFTVINDTLRALSSDEDSARALRRIESELASLQKNMASSWESLNSWESQLRKNASMLDQQELNLSAREMQLDAQDAALRGQLHDLTRYHEQIVEREKELAAQLAKIQEERDAVHKAQTELGKREAEITRRADELRSREHVLAQRWARIQATTCPHCGKALRGAQGGSK